VLTGAIAAWHGLPSLFVPLPRCSRQSAAGRSVRSACALSPRLLGQLGHAQFPGRQRLRSDLRCIALSTMTFGLWRNRSRSPLATLRDAAPARRMRCARGSAAAQRSCSRNSSGAAPQNPQDFRATIAKRRFVFNAKIDAIADKLHPMVGRKTCRTDASSSS